MDEQKKPSIDININTGSFGNSLAGCVASLDVLADAVDAAQKALGDYRSHLEQMRRRLDGRAP